MREENDIRDAIVGFWKTVLLAMLAFAAMVVYIFVSSALQWKHEQRLLALAAQQKEMARLAKVGVCAWVNDWEIADKGVRGVNQVRSLKRLEAGVEYEVGRLRYYDVNLKRGFDQVMEVGTDDPVYVYPLITVRYANFIHVRYSVDGGAGWMMSGGTRRGIKIDDWTYTLPEEYETNDTRDGWAEQSLTFSVSVNGREGIEVGAGSELVSEAMRPYNMIETVRLGDVYNNVPEQYADRTRNICTSHVIIECWKSDPRVRRADGDPDKVYSPTPELTVKLRIRSYGEWDITAEEFESMRYKVLEFSDRNLREFSPYVTVEFIP